MPMPDPDKPYIMIEEQAAADFLLTSKHSEYLYPFLSEACTLSDVADLFEVNLSSFYHHVKMIDFGLIEEVGTTLRNNRQVKLYKAVSEQFVVPVNVGSSTTLETHMQEHATVTAEEMGRLFARGLLSIADEWGFLISLGDKGLSKIIVPKASSRRSEEDIVEDFYPTYWRNATYQLSDDDATQLAHELEDLHEKYATKSLEADDQAKSQKVVLFVAPKDS